MAYTQYTLDDLSSQLGVLLDDQSNRYWVVQEKYYAVWEALRYWGACTSYWRTRGTFNLAAATPYYDLAAQLPALRTRTWTLNQMVQEIQYQCLEAANGITGSGMSAQISITSILQAISRARNQFVLDLKLPYTYHAAFASPGSGGIVDFPQDSVYVHRAAWQDAQSGTWTNLWRQDAWAIDKSDPTWTTNPGQPAVYSESENSPLKMQLAPEPQGAGTLEAITVDSLLIDLTNPAATFEVPDEWVHAIKYAALADIFTAESQNKDIVRGQYAGMRYQQSVDLAKEARSVIRLLIGGVPLPLDSFAAIDAGYCYWRNQSMQPFVAGALYDFLMFAPVPNAAYGIAADVVQSAPIPLTGTDAVPIGDEDLDHILDYATHWLTFKCGGKEFQDTFAQYDDFMKAAAARGRINKAKIQYLVPLLGQAQKESAERPDMMEAPHA